jgi:hypothetical protein
MAIRRPLVLVNGVLQELPLTDSLPGLGASADTFETVSKNLSSEDATLHYTGDLLTSIAYSNGITKTFAYGPDGLSTVTLSGAVPGGIDLVKTLVYSAGNLVGVTYS